MVRTKQLFVPRKLSQAGIALFASIPLFFLTACFCRGPGCIWPAAAPPPPSKPGLYDQDGWNGTRADVDINGEVGHPLYVLQPKSDCEDGAGNAGNWDAYLSISSGALPPGMSMDNHGTISGIPTARGHWIAEMEEGALTCNGKSYPGFTQQLRFHITGSGNVVQ